MCLLKAEWDCFAEWMFEIFTHVNLPLCYVTTISEASFELYVEEIYHHHHTSFKRLLF